MPAKMAEAYEAARRYCQALRRVRPSAGLLQTLLLRRIGSSLAAGLRTARALLERADTEDLTQEEDEEAQVGPDGGVEAPGAPGEDAQEHLWTAVAAMEATGNADPKLLVALRYLRDEGWATRGCILFSQYFDTVWWLAGHLARELGGTTVGVYAGQGRSYLIQGEDAQRAERAEIQDLVKSRQLKVLVATDAASEGLNLQRLQTLINVDLPWNPSRLEQRKGRIERIGQEAETIDILNLRYRGSVEDDVHRALADRLKQIRDVFGTIPDTIEDVWVAIALGEKQAAQRLIDAVPREHPFDLRYGRLAVTDDWPRCEQVLNRIDLVEALRRPWKG